MAKPMEQKKMEFLRIVKTRLPILGWLPKYSKSDLIADFIAGLTVGLTMIPQSIAYANLAGLPPQYGLYTAFVGSFTYVIFGTIKEVSIGPTSLMALLALSYVEGLPVEFMILLTFLVGCVELAMGLLKLGFLVDFISPCVTSGFTSAMSVTITISQLKNLLGLKKLQNHGVFDVIGKVVSRYREIQMADAILGFSCIAFLFAFKKLTSIKTQNRKMKKSLWFLSISRNAIVVAVTSVVAYLWVEYGDAVPFNLSGKVPQGFPDVRVPSFSAKVGNETYGFLDMVGTFRSGVVVIPVSAVLANVAIAKSFTTGIVVDVTQEMMTLGLCNIFGSFVQALPSCGAFTRSAVASSSGVRTPLQGVYSGTVIVLALTFLTPYFFYIPRATLAAVLISAIITMFDYEIFPKLWKCNKFDFFLTLITLIVGVMYGVEIGIIIGAVCNIAILLKLWTRPQILKEIRSDNGGNNYVSIKPEIGLFYPAMDYLLDSVAIAHNEAKHLPLVLDCSNIINLDYAGCQAINVLLKTYNKTHEVLTLQNVKHDIYDTLTTTLNCEKLPIFQGTQIVVEGAPCEKPLLSSSHRKMSNYDNV